MTLAQSSTGITPSLCSPLVGRKEAAKYLGIAPQTLAQWACSGRYNLPLVKIGRSVKYHQSDLDAFISNNTHKDGAAPLKGWPQ